MRMLKVSSWLVEVDNGSLRCCPDVVLAHSLVVDTLPLWLPVGESCVYARC